MAVAPLDLDELHDAWREYAHELVRAQRNKDILSMAELAELRSRIVLRRTLSLGLAPLSGSDLFRARPGSPPLSCRSILVDDSPQARGAVAIAARGLGRLDLDGGVAAVDVVDPDAPA